MGNSGILRGGDVQWTGGRFRYRARRGTRPSRWRPARVPNVGKFASHLKMSDPAYQDVPSGDIPVVKIKDGVEAKVLAGTCHQRNAVVQTKVECQYLDFHITLEGKSDEGMEYTHIVPTHMTTGHCFCISRLGHFWCK